MSASTPPSSFSHLSLAPLDPHYTLKRLFAADSHEKKVILGSGIYRDDNSQPWVLPTVKKVSDFPILLQRGEANETITG
jgi:aspartate aminotransferase